MCEIISSFSQSYVAIVIGLYFIKTFIKRDFKWFNVFPQSYNGVTIYHVAPLHERMHLEASLQDIGGVYNNYVYAIAFPPNFRQYNI